MSQQRYWAAPTWPRRKLESRAVLETYTTYCKLLAERTGIRPEARVLDIGTGHGPLMYHLSKQFPGVVGLDFSAHMLSLNPCRGRLVRGNVESLPFLDGTFDLVVSSALLHHLAPQEQVNTIREMARVSRNAVAILEPNRMNPAMFLFGLVKSEERGLLGLGRRHLRQMLASVKLEAISSTVNGLVLPNSMPGWLLPLASALNQSWLARAAGFYVLCVGRKPDGAAAAGQ